MIELGINGRRRSVQPRSARELCELIDQELPTGHVIYAVQANGRIVDSDQLSSFDVGVLREVSVESATPAEIARNSLGETREWMGRIMSALDAVSRDYRFGRERNAHARLVEVIDALQVLVNLLGSIRTFLVRETPCSSGFESSWVQAEHDLRDGVDGLLSDLEKADPIELADRTGYALPSVLAQFRDLLGRLDS